MSMGIADNVRRFREAKGLSQAALAKLVGTSQPTIDKIERGETTRSRYLPNIAAALGVTITEIDDAIPVVIPARQNTSMPDQMPIYASAEGGDGCMILDFTPIDYEQRPDAVRHVRDAYGFYITGNSMEPRYEQGERVIVNPKLPPKPGVYAVFIMQDSDGNTHATIKRLARITPDHWQVQQFNPAKSFNLDRKLWTECHVVIGSLTN